METLIEQNITTSSAYQAAEVYERFIVASIFRYWTPLFLERAAPRPGDRVLDVACGTGVVARSMVPMVGERGKVVGLDINPAMLAVACKQFADHCDEIDWHEGQAEALPFADEDFDLVTCQQGLQFFKNKPKAALEMHRVLRPNGRVAIEVWQSTERNRIFGMVFEAIAAAFNVPAANLTTPYAYGDPDELALLLIKAGFQHVKVEAVQKEAHFSEVNRFVELTIKGASAVIPAFANLDNNLRTELLSKVSRQVAGELNEHVRDGMLTFPMYANIATGVV